MNIFYNYNDVHHLSCTYIDNCNWLSSFFGWEISSPFMRSGWSFRSQHAALLYPRNGHVTKPGPISVWRDWSQWAANWSALDIPPSLLCPFSELTCSSAGHSQDTDGFPPPTPMSLLFLYLRHFSSAIETWLNPNAECSQVLGIDTLRDHPQPIRGESLWTNRLLASLSLGGRILTYIPNGAPEGPTRPAQLPTV